jgi:hypothetical protein
MEERRGRRRDDDALAAAQLYLESCVTKFPRSTVVLATDDGFALAGTGTESDLTELSALASVPEIAAEHGVRTFAFAVGTLSLRLGILGTLPEEPCARDLTRILAPLAA